MPKTVKPMPQKAAPAAKRPKELTLDQKLAKLYRTLHAQLEASFFSNALKTCDRILRLAPTDALAGQTKVQLLIALEQYPGALSLLAEKEKKTSVEVIYCLYKTGRVVEAQEAIRSLDDEAKDDRAVQLLEAQVSYRLEDFGRARDIYDDLLATAEGDSPEIPDIQTNLAASTSHLDFLSSVPALLSSSAVPSLERLESDPVGRLIHAHALYKTTPVASTSKTYPQTKAPSDKKERAQLDPDRWLPKRERPGFAEEIVRKREVARGKTKQAALLTQGSSSEPAAVAQKQATGGAGRGGKSSKKKGKR